MKRFVITIGREFGCSASGVGRKLAEKLGVNFYERELVDKAREISGMDETTIYNLDHKKHGVDKVKQYVNEFGFGVSNSDFSEKAVQAQASAIREIAGKESCVMFGRCADYFLSSYDNVLNVFLYAPVDFRLNHVVKAYDLTKHEASVLIKKVDRRRHMWYKYVTGKSREDRTNRHIMFNMKDFSVDEVVEIIYQIAVNRFNLK